MKAKNIQGNVYGKLTVVDRASNIGKNAYWNCVCTCGNSVVTMGSSLRSGNTNSCGCLRLEKLRKKIVIHGESKTKLFKVWTAMICRCHAKSDPNYEIYGGRGVIVCDRWRYSYKNFIDDMGYPKDGMTIDRIDNDGIYSPDNCRWATRTQQQRNIRSNVNLTFNGKTQCISAWANEIGIKVGTLQCRITRYKWDIEKALTKNVQDWGRTII